MIHVVGYPIHLHALNDQRHSSHPASFWYSIVRNEALVIEAKTIQITKNCGALGILSLLLDHKNNLVIQAVSS
jgi:hypothetical protein